MEKIPEIELRLTTVEVKSEVRKLRANTKRWVRLPRKIKKQLKKEFTSQQEWLEWSHSPVKFGYEAGDPIDVIMSDEARDWFNRRNDPVEYDKMLSEQEAKGVITSRMWNKLHAVCPKCGNEHTATTFAGPINVWGEDYADNVNRADCSCGWRGKVAELVPKK